MSRDNYSDRYLTVTTRPRQMRLAYLIDPASSSLALLDALFSACTRGWGGRLFPIIPVVDGIISPGHWMLLRVVDPDSIYSYTALPQALVDRLHSEINPLTMERHAPQLTAGDHPHYFPSHNYDPVHASRLLPYAMKMGGHQKPVLVTYNGRNGPPNPLILRNFGIFNSDSLSEEIPKHIPQFSFDGNAGFAEFLEQLTEQRAWVYPFTASASRALVDSGLNSHDTTYTIYVGDELEALISFWNHIFLSGPGLRANWRMFCLPAAELRETRTVEALAKFFRRFARRNADRPPCIHWTSAKLAEEEVKDLAAPFLNKKLDAYHEYSQYVPWSFPELPKREYSSFEFRGGGPGSLELFGVTAQQIPKGGGLMNIRALPFATTPNEHWMQDVRIQYVAEHPYYANEDLKYQLPRRLGIAQSFCDLPGRIDADGGLSFSMGHRFSFFLKIPDDRGLILAAIGCGRFRGYDGNLKRRDIAPVYQDHGPSDKARYCRGVLDLFAGLANANRLFENRFWREKLFQLAGLGGREQAAAPSMVQLRIAKHPERWTIDPAIPRDQEITRIEKEIIKLTQHVRIRENEITFQYLQEQLVKEREEFFERNQEMANKRNRDSQTELDEVGTNLRRTIQEFVNAKILRQGVVARCRHCGSRIWRELSDLEQEFKCTGCGSSARTPVEATWYYRLNALVSSAITEHGTVALIGALSRAREQARNSFIFSPGLEFYENFSDRESVAEIDAICLVDGSLWIGEVKTNASEFKPQEMKKLQREAHKMSADKAFVYALEGNQEALSRRCEEISKANGIPVFHLRPHMWASEPSLHA